MLVLEAGKYFRPEDFTQRELEMVQKLYVDKGGQLSASGSISILQGRMVGGSTTVNGEVCFRIPPFVLEEWASDFGVPAMSEPEMAPIFAEVERRIHVTENEGTHLAVATRPAVGMKALGIEAKPIARNVKNCRGCNYCFWGCAWGCKQSTEQSYLPAAAEHGARLISECRVERLIRNGSRVTGVQARTPKGTVEVEAQVVVLACGAIETPLMLMDHGLGGGDVGLHLAVHPVVFGSGLFDEPKPERPGALIGGYSDHYLGEGILLETAGASRAFHAIGVPGVGREHKERVRDWLPRIWGGGAIVRDVSGPGRVLRDRKGQKVIQWDLDAPTTRTLRRAMKVTARILLRAGAERVWFATTQPRFICSEAELSMIDSLPVGPADLGLVSYHPQGTARMGSVTDFDGRVRGVDSLYVMDTSLFPTPVGVNPQVAVMALSTLLARRLAASLS